MSLNRRGRETRAERGLNPPRRSDLCYFSVTLFRISPSPFHFLLTADDQQFRRARRATDPQLAFLGEESEAA
jgi:hypothetical protein